MTDALVSLTPGRLLTAAAFQTLAQVPPELEWFANLGSKATRRAYEHALADFMRFTCIVQPEEFRTVTRAHVIAWRDKLAGRALSGMRLFLNSCDTAQFAARECEAGRAWRARTSGA